MAKDFDPQSEVVSYRRWTRNRIRRSFRPAVGSRVSVVYIEATPAAASEINAKLVEIATLATYAHKVAWTPTAESGKEPQVDVRVGARTNMEPEA